ncbi:MAG: hypothetical protein WB037_22280 [Pseudolabrys sp.]
MVDFDADIGRDACDYDRAHPVGVHDSVEVRLVERVDTGWLEAAPISRDDKVKIFDGNARRLPRV